MLSKEHFLIVVIASEELRRAWQTILISMDRFVPRDDCHSGLDPES